MNTELKSFNLERALKGDKVINRLGFEVYDFKYHYGVLWGQIKGITDPNKYDELWTKDGEYISISEPDSYDLFMES